MDKKAVIDCRRHPRCCHLGSYFKRPKSSSVPSYIKPEVLNVSLRRPEEVRATAIVTCTKKLVMIERAVPEV